MIKYRSFFKFLKRVKENLNLIVLIPTILGGLWQILELASISSSYIRFFSLKQLISDGLLILFISILFYIVVKLSYTTFLKLIDEGNWENDDSIKTKVQRVVFLFLTAIGTFILFYYFHSKDIFPLEKLLTFGGVIIFCVLLILKGFQIILFTGKNRERRIQFFSDNSKGIVLLCLIIFALILKPTIHITKEYRTLLLLPQDLTNRKVIGEKVKAKYKLLNNPTLIYLNDTYIFYNVCRKNGEKEILMIETKELFNISDEKKEDEPK